jgi:hypothetical protein
MRGFKTEISPVLAAADLVWIAAAKLPTRKASWWQLDQVAEDIWLRPSGTQWLNRRDIRTMIYIY